MKTILSKKIFLVSIISVIIIIAGFSIAYFSETEESEVITGLVEVTQIDVASKIPGRITTVLVQEGESVHKGDTLALLESKELDAKMGQGLGSVQAAKSRYLMAVNGARTEEIEIAEDLYTQAEAQFNYAEKTFNRIQSLYSDEVVSKQDRDQAEFQYIAAKKQYEAAKLKYMLIKKGARYEDIMGAEGQYNAANSLLSEIKASYTELAIQSPSDGEISKRINDPGEIVAAGFPVFTLIDLREMYILLQVREDELNKFALNKVLRVQIPAIGDSEHQFMVSYIAVMADFANWKATNRKGDFDLKTFEVRLKPIQAIKNLRPGMTARIRKS